MKVTQHSAEMILQSEGEYERQNTCDLFIQGNTQVSSFTASAVGVNLYNFSAHLRKPNSFLICLPPCFPESRGRVEHVFPPRKLLMDFVGRVGQEQKGELDLEFFISCLQTAGFAVDLLVLWH